MESLKYRICKIIGCISINKAFVTTGNKQQLQIQILQHKNTPSAHELNT